MTNQKIAILTDSGCDIPADVIHEPLFFLPLRITIDQETYIDGEISTAEVLEAAKTKSVTTSLPSPQLIEDTLNSILEKGYTHVITISISSGLSGTFGVIQSISSSFEGLIIECIDTRNISIGSGFSVLYALECIEKGQSFEQIVQTTLSRLELNRVFFTVDSLEALRKGGRIGLVAGTVADVLNIKPIISCNADGVYYTLKKVRGYKRAVDQLIQTVSDIAKNALSVDIMMLNADSKLNLKSLEETIRNTIPTLRQFTLVNITPSLAIHTGKETIGLGISIQ